MDHATPEPASHETRQPTPLRRLAVWVGVAVLVVSSAVTAWPLWDQLHDFRRVYGPMSSAERERAAGTQNAFDAASWDELRSRLRRGDRYAVIGQPETTEDAAIENLVARTYASFWLLPAVQVRSPAAANALIYFKPATRPPGAECFPSERPVCIRRLR